jgi:hypothetical protein
VKTGALLLLFREVERCARLYMVEIPTVRAFPPVLPRHAGLKLAFYVLL